MRGAFLRTSSLSPSATLLVNLMLMSSSSLALAASPFYVGADVSMLPEIERAGGVYRDDGQPQDCLRILADHGYNLFRLRLFVNPTKDFNKSWGATQDLACVRALAKRVKAVGGSFLLDLHYSDTWADPGKQFKPSAWKDLDFDALEKRVHDYTAEVLADLAKHDASPDMVQVGNEIASGILWPDGKVLNAKGDDEALQWQRFTRLLNAGAKAVREASKSGQPIQIMLHVHGGGRRDMAKWFFGEKLGRYPVDYDIVGLSFYPAWDDRMGPLKQNLIDAVRATGKDVIVAETSYPWRPIEGAKSKEALEWPQTLDGQRRFLQDLVAAIRATPDDRGRGFIYWYPEAIPVTNLHIWRGGGEALFDAEGNALPALNLFEPSKALVK